MKLIIPISDTHIFGYQRHLLFIYIKLCKTQHIWLSACQLELLEQRGTEEL